MAIKTSPLAPATKAVKLLCLVGLAAGLAACGQRGPLVPPSASTPQTEAGAPAPTKADNIPDDGFVLDPLL